MTFYRTLRFFDSYCFHGRSQLFHFTLLFLLQKHHFDPWPFFASFPDMFFSKTFGNKMFTFIALHICSKLFFFFFNKQYWLNLTVYFTDRVMVLVFISAAMSLPWSVLIDLPIGDAPHTCSLSYIISYYQCLLTSSYWLQDKER